MIPYIDTQLSIWGRWSVARASRGLGFSPVCPMFKQARYGGGFGSAVPVGVAVDCVDNIHDTDTAVSRMSVDQKRLCVEYYVVGGKGNEVAARLGVARRTMFDRLHCMHQALLGHLNDVAAGC